jgi:metallo-beta-lactamase class B
MTLRLWMLLAASGIAACAPAAEEKPAPEVVIEPDPAHECGICERLNEPAEPYRIYGDTYYVGTKMISAVLIDGGDGLVLVNGGMTQTAPLIADSIKALGFSVADLKLIVNTHAHFDHAGGIAALARVTGAEVAASEEGVVALEQGHPPENDPQRGLEDNVFPPVTDVRGVKDGESLTVGDVAITAHLTPAHTPGSAAWTWRSCEDERCVDVVFADSFSTRSAPDFRFTAEEGRVETFRAAIDVVAELPCDILLTPSPASFGAEEKLSARAADPEAEPFIDPEACRAYAASATAGLDKRIEEEQAGE